MGNTACCKTDVITQTPDETADATPILDGPLKGIPAVSGGASPQERSYTVTLSKAGGDKLGLDVDYMAERKVLPIMSITGGLSQKWNDDNPGKMMNKGDSIIEVNSISDNVASMLEQCKSAIVLKLTLQRAFNYDFLVQDLENLISAKNCGPNMVSISYAAGVFNGKIGSPSAAMPSVALSLLKPISDKYCPQLISHSDLWVLSANVAIRVMGGPEIPARFGRVDAKAASEGEASSPPDGGKGADYLRTIFKPKGFDDKSIVALAGAHTIGSDSEGPATENLKFDSTYFKELLKLEGKPPKRRGNQMMLVSDMALLEDPDLKGHVKKYAEDEQAWFTDFTQAWVKIQELGFSDLREIL